MLLPPYGVSKPGNDGMFGLLDNPFGDLKSYGPEDNRFMNSGSLIAVSYEARARGVKRSMRGAEAKKVRSSMHISHFVKGSQPLSLMFPGLP
jgi:hypothetical protein